MPLRPFLSPPSEPSPTGESLCRLCAERGTSCCSTDPALTYLSFPISAAEWRRMVPYAGLATTAPQEDTARYQEEELRAQAEAEALLLNAPMAGNQQTCAPEASNQRASNQQACGLRHEPPQSRPPEDGDAIVASEPNLPDFVASIRALFPRDKRYVEGLFPLSGTHLTMRTRSDGTCVFAGSVGCRLPREVRPWYCRMFPAWITDGSLTLFLSEDCLISQRASGPAHGLSLLGETPGHIRKLHSGLCRDWGLAES